MRLACDIVEQLKCLNAPNHAFTTSLFIYTQYLAMYRIVAR